MERDLYRRYSDSRRVRRPFCIFTHEAIPPFNAYSWFRITKKCLLQLIEAKVEYYRTGVEGFDNFEEKIRVTRRQESQRGLYGPISMEEEFMDQIIEAEARKNIGYSFIWDENAKKLKSILHNLRDYGNEMGFPEQLELPQKRELQNLFRQACTSPI